MAFRPEGIDEKSECGQSWEPTESHHAWPGTHGEVCGRAETKQLSKTGVEIRLVKEHG